MNILMNWQDLSDSNLGVVAWLRDQKKIKSDQKKNKNEIKKK